MPSNQIDIIRTCTSRPEVFNFTMDSLRKHLKFSGKMRYIVHEDVVDIERQEKFNFSECDVVKTDNPPLGQGSSIYWLLEQVQTDIILNIEDDFRLLKDINLDELTNLMNKHKDINQITFNKRPRMDKKFYFTKKKIERDGIPLTTNMYWTCIPSLWRVDFIKNKISKGYCDRYNINFCYGINNILRQLFGMGLQIEDYNAEWVMKNVGTYFLGSYKDKKMLKENGGTMMKEEYDAIDNGFYFQHLGFKPYEPEKWIWPIPKPIEKPSNVFHSMSRTKDGKKWNPSISL
jgi:hypothetical protein